jgi:hypothetical protein
LETSLVFHSHPTEVTWEEYAFGRLSEKKIPPLEEHLLACELCQASLEELTQYIQLMKAGLVNGKVGPLDRLAGTGRFLGSVLARLRGVMCAAALAAGSMSLWIALRAAPPAATTPVTAQVMLTAFQRGDVDMTRAPAGRPLGLHISTGDVPAAPEYRLVVVTASGKQVWNSVPDVSSGSLSVHLPRGLAAGPYWVRLYTRQAEILGEFGLLLE